MPKDHTLARQHAHERHPPVQPARPVVAAADGMVGTAQRLQRRLGNSGIQALFAKPQAQDRPTALEPSVQHRGAASQPAIQARLYVSSPSDREEMEAEAAAKTITRMADPAPASSAKPGVSRALLQRRADGPGEASPEVAAEIQASLSSGIPLPTPVRRFMEVRFQADFSQIRIHTDARANSLNRQLNAQAFTYGRDIFFGSGRFQPDTEAGHELIAHELTHTLQQGGGRPRVERKSLLDKLGEMADSALDFGESLGWDMVREYAPTLEPIIRKGPEGIFDWLKDRASNAFEGMFSSLMAPVRSFAGIGQQLTDYFAPVLVSVQAAAGKIAQNDCTPLREAAEKIEKTAEEVITPIVEKIQPVVAKVKAFLGLVWDKIGAPILEAIKQYAADQWALVMLVANQAQKAANWLWDKTASIRALAEKGWIWLKNKLGVGEGAEGQDGLLQWVQRKLEAAWDWLKVKLEPFKKEITAITTTVGAVLLALSPAGPALALYTAVTNAMPGLRWIYANWGKGNMVAQARVYLEKTLIPPLQGALVRMDAAVARLAGSVIDALSRFAAGLSRTVGALGGTVFNFAISAIQWIVDQMTAAAEWARQELAKLSRWLGGALIKLEAFLGRMVQFFAKVGGVILDIYGLPILLAGDLWEKVPACVRTPIEDFLGPIILGQIELFQELVKDNEAWQKTKAEVGKLIKLVFKDHDLVGAVKAAFNLVLRVFNLPPDLLAQVAQKAMSAWDTISKKPLDFIKNTVRALGHGFKRLWANIGEHLEFGLKGWLLGEIKEKNIEWPQSWSEPKDVFWFAVSVMGLTVDHLWELLAQRFPPEKVRKVREWFGRISRALDWINKAIDTSKTPQENSKGLVNQGKEFGKSILTGLANWVAGKVAEELATLAAAAAASGGLSEVLDVARRIYKAMLTAKRYARKILDMANETLDNIAAIAKGSVEAVGVTFEKIMHKGMPVVIGFLAGQVGLGGVGKALRETIDTLREKVDEALLWLIDKVKAGIEALIGAVKSGVAAVLEWWKKKLDLHTADGKKHEIWFSGTEDSAVPMVASDPKAVEDFLKEVGGRAEGQKKPGSDQIASVRKQLNIIKTEQKKPKDVRDGQVIENAFAAMVAPLEALLGSGPLATKDNPLPIKYPKPTWTQYPTIYVGPLSEKRIPQSLLKSGLVTEIRAILSNKESAAWDGKIQSYSPSSSAQSLPNNNSHPGIASQYRTEKGLVIELHPGSTQGGKLVNDLFRPYGYRAKEEDGSESKDGDHLVEMQLGGPNELKNLWPLDAGLNRSGGATVKTMQVDIPAGGTISMDELKKRSEIVPTYLTIKETK